MKRFATLFFVLLGFVGMGCAKPVEPKLENIPTIPPGRSQTEFRGGPKGDPHASPVPLPPARR